MFKSRTKLDLIIEVWEKLDCESIGAAEIEAIEMVVCDKFGQQAVESPMRIARELADEGAELRHHEILTLDVQRRSESPYDAMFRNILKLSDFKQTLSSIRQIENLRAKFDRDKDKEGLRLLRKLVITNKDQLLEISRNSKITDKERHEKAEIAEWLKIYLQSPEVFDSWIKIRRNSEDFKNKFGAENSI